MKLSPSILAVFLLAGSTAAQSGFSSLLSIASTADRPTSIAVADLDGDGRTDVLSASASDNKIAWYRNLGRGAFGPERTISTAAVRAQFVQAADLDGDGLTDVLSVSLNDNKVAWYRNLGGGTFGSQVVLSTAIATPYCVRAADLDGDGDLDVLVGYLNATGQIAWFENLGPRAGSTAFSAARLVASGVTSVVDVLTRDLDGDGDVDVLASAGAAFGVGWFPNLGLGAFGPARPISTTTTSFRSAQVADVDGDGDPDVLTTEPTGAVLAWNRNLGAGRFGPKQVISTGVAGCRAVAAADFDLDGDMDVAAIGLGAFNQVAWFENLGAGAFGPLRGIEPGNSPRIVGGVAIDVADLSGDGSPDVIVAASSNDVVGWYANLLGVAQTFGVGCGAQPLIQRPTSRPVLGQSAQAEIQNVPGTLCVLMAGLDRTTHPAFGTLPFDLSPIGMSGCTLVQSGEVPAVPTSPTAQPGVFTWSMPLSPNAAFQGLSLYTQAFAIAPGANPLGVTASNGIAWRLGH